MTFKSMRLAALIFLAVPMAACGGILALAIRGMPFSISAGVGFIALFGVAVLNGLVWVSGAEHMRVDGMAPRIAAYETALVRLAPRADDRAGRQSWGSCRWRCPRPPVPRFNVPWPRS